MFNISSLLLSPSSSSSSITIETDLWNVNKIPSIKNTCRIKYLKSDTVWPNRRRDKEETKCAHVLNGRKRQKNKSTPLDMQWRAPYYSERP